MLISSQHPKPRRPWLIVATIFTAAVTAVWWCDRIQRNRLWEWRQAMTSIREISTEPVPHPLFGWIIAGRVLATIEHYRVVVITSADVELLTSRKPPAFPSVELRVAPTLSESDVERLRGWMPGVEVRVLTPESLPKRLMFTAEGWVPDLNGWP